MHTQIGFSPVMEKYNEITRWFAVFLPALVVVVFMIYLQMKLKSTQQLYISVFSGLTDGDYRKTSFFSYSAGGVLATGTIRGHKVGLSPSYASICLNRKGIIRKFVFGNWKTMSIRMIYDGRQNISRRLSDAYSELIEHVEKEVTK